MTNKNAMVALYDTHEEAELAAVMI